MMLVSQLMSTKKATMFPVNIFKEKVNHSCDAGNSSKESKFSKPCVKFGHVNARSLYPKLDEINAVVVKHDFDVFCVSEKWLGEQFKDNDLEIPDYSIYRKDRVDALGGGVCIYIKNHLTVKIRKDLMFDEIEAIWLELNKGDKRCCLISCIYRSPSSSQAYYSKVVDMYERAQLDDIPIISMGDLNYDYKLDESLSNNPIHYIEMAYEMTQLILQPTRETSDTSTALDIILVSHPSLHTSRGVMKYNFSDHYLVYTEFEFNLFNQKGSTHNVVKFRDMKRFNPENFLNDLNSCEILNGSLYDEDISWEKWKLKLARSKKRSDAWITPDVVKLMYRPDHVHAKAVRTKSDILFDQYRSLRNQVTKVIKENKQKYYNEINSLCATDPKKMWSEINKANLRDLIAATGLVILLKFDPNHRFFSPCDLEIWCMTSKNNRAPLLYYIKLCVSFQIHWWIQTEVTLRKRSIRVEIGDFFVPCDLEIWWMTLENDRAPLLYYILLCVISNPSVIWNWSYSPETLNLGQNWQFFVPCDFEIWRMPLKNNRAPLLCCFKLCASFPSHQWIQTGVTVRKRPIWVKFDNF